MDKTCANMDRVDTSTGRSKEIFGRTRSPVTLDSPASMPVCANQIPVLHQRAQPARHERGSCPQKSLAITVSLAWPVAKLRRFPAIASGRRTWTHTAGTSDASH